MEKGLPRVPWLVSDRQTPNQAPDPGLAFLYTVGPQEAVDSFQAVAIAPTVCSLSVHCHQHQPKRGAGKPVSLFYSHGFKKIYLVGKKCFHIAFHMYKLIWATGDTKFMFFYPLIVLYELVWALSLGLLCAQLRSVQTRWRLSPFPKELRGDGSLVC